MQLSVILGLVFAILVTIFTIFNAAPVTVNLFVTDLEISLALIIIVSMLIGAMMIAVIDTVRKYRNSKELKIANKKIEDLEKQIKIKEEALKQRDVMILQKDEIIQNLKKTTETELPNV